MKLLQLPWLELAILVALSGSPLVGRVRDTNRAYAWGVSFTGLALACSFMAWLGYQLGVTEEMLRPWSLQRRVFGRTVLGLDAVNAPLVPAVALLHFLVAGATSRTSMRVFSLSWSLAAEAIRLATFAAEDTWVLVALLATSTVPPYVELVNRRRPTRLYLIHMGVFVALLVMGRALLGVGGSPSGAASWWAILPLAAAVLILCGTVPAHCWVTDWFEHASLGIAILTVAPLAGVYAAVRLVLPVAPGWVLGAIALASVLSALYTSALATVQQDTRRFFALLSVSLSALVLVGIGLHTDLTICAGLCLWFSAILSLGGFGLTLRAIEARLGRLSLASFHGLYEHTPMLAIFFLITGLASVGFPATIGFIALELLVDGAVDANLLVGVGIVIASAFNGIAVLRAYFHLFTGARHVSTVFLGIGLRERVAVLTLSALILGGGVFPQPGVTSRELAARAILEGRRQLGFAVSIDHEPKPATPPHHDPTAPPPASR